jgi:hypothetical protein
MEKMVLKRGGGLDVGVLGCWVLMHYCDELEGVGREGRRDGVRE